MNNRKAGMIVMTLVLLSTFHLALTILPSNVNAVTLYVGGTGPGNFTTIQSAIVNADPGDTVYVYGGTYFENLEIDIPLSLVGEDKVTTEINGSHSGSVINITADWVNITGFKITYGGEWWDEGSGVNLLFVENCSITNNNISWNKGPAVHLYYSNYNTVSNNFATMNDHHPFHLEYSNHNMIAGNNATSNHWGFKLSRSNNNTITGNDAVNNGHGHYGSGIDLTYSHNNTVEDNSLYYHNEYGIYVHVSKGNIINGNRMYFNLRGMHIGTSDENVISNNIVIQSGLSGIYVDYSFNNTFRFNYLMYNSVGIVLIRSGYNAIANNTAVMNWNRGMYVYVESNNNTIVDNMLVENDEGLWVEGNDNNIYHNRFVDNSPQALDSGVNSWDDGYPSGGNYWSDYTGLDEKSGPDQDQLGSDGIGDTRYDITGGTNQDRYPLMSPGPPTVPYAPLSLRATAGNRQVTLEWEEPYWDGGSAITNYRIYRGTVSGEETFLVEIGNILTYTDTGLTGGHTYHYKVSAVNSAGEGPQSNGASATPPNQNPTCTITSPSQGETVSGTINITGSATDTDGSVQMVEIRVDDGHWTEVTGTTSWSYHWDTETVSNGNHTIYARSFDGWDYSTVTNVTVFVENAHAEEPEQDMSLVTVAVIIAAVILLALVVLMSRMRKRPVEVEHPSE
ncbi:MAG: hypothetical protein E3J35_04470 [Methanomassiliicoccales archaeon]|nr:MAG: hypothetical protein E3J35_04470 [Methanomassiliicoccales archaeon]